jgi:PAS domain S-box-containing protein
MGYTRAEVIGKTSLELNIWHDSADRHRLVNILKTEGYAENIEPKFRRRDGEIRSGGPAGIRGILIDLSTAKHAEVEKKSSKSSSSRRRKWRP